VASAAVTGGPPSMSTLLWLLRTPTPPLAVQPDGIINKTFFDVSRLSVMR